METIGTWWMWAGFFTIVLIMLAIDLVVVGAGAKILGPITVGDNARVAANSVVIDAVRCLKLAMDRGISGPLFGPSAYLMKTPPKQYTDDIARQMTDAFITGEELPAAIEGLKPKVPAAKK